MATATIGKTSEITIFLKEGSTLTFYDCEILKYFGVDNDLGDVCNIVFTYVSKETRKRKRALFCTSEIAGHSFHVPFKCSYVSCNNDAVDQLPHEQPCVCSNHDPGR